MDFAVIAFHVYGSIDLVLFCILQLINRGRTSADADARFLDRVGLAAGSS
jgi:hypothetical protein